MRSIRNLTFALFAATAFAGGPAYANMLPGRQIKLRHRHAD